MARQNFYREILARSLKDKIFREKLINSPRKTLKEEFDINIPEGINIKVLEDSPSEHYIVLPHMTPPFKIDEKELYIAAGMCEFFSSCNTGKQSI
jgi:hypothetical protein